MSQDKVNQSIARSAGVQAIADKRILHATLSLANDEAWILYEDGYVQFGRLDESSYQEERISHYMLWEDAVEDPLLTEDYVLGVMEAIIDNLPRTGE